MESSPFDRSESHRNDERARFSADLKKLALAILLLVCGLNLVAAYSSIALFYDSAYYLLGVLVKDGINIIEPTATTTQTLQQLPLWLALFLGVENTGWLVTLCGASNLMLPLLLTASCYWILPKPHKMYFIFPLLAYLAGALASWAPTVTDAPPAAAYFWVLLVFVLFRPYDRWFVGFAIVLAWPAPYLHESFVFLGPLLMLAAYLRSRTTQDQVFKLLLLALALWFGYVTYQAFMGIAHPRSPGNRSGFIAGLLQLKWIYADSLNVVVVSSAVSGFLALILALDRLTAGRILIVSLISRVSVYIAVATAVALTLWIAKDGNSYGFFTQFAARSQASFVSFALALVVLVSTLYPAVERSWTDRRILVFTALLGMTGVLWHGSGLMVWRQYIDGFRTVLQDNTGYVSFEAALKSLPPEHQRDFRRLSRTWTLPTVSILLATDRKVTSIIGRPAQFRGRWQPFDPCGSALPKAGFDYSRYYEAIRVQGCSETP